MRFRTIRRNFQSRFESQWVRLRSQFVDVEKLKRQSAADVSFGVIVLEFNSAEHQLTTVESISNQLYRNHSTHLPRPDQSVVRRIVDAARTSDFVAMLDPGTVLEPDALFWSAISINSAHDRPDWIYFDHVETRGHDWGRRIGLGVVGRDGTSRDVPDQVFSATRCDGELQPVHKPSFSPEYLLSGMFAGGFNVFSSQSLLSIFDRFNLTTDDALDTNCLQFEIALRLNELEKQPRVERVPQIAYSNELAPSPEQMSAQKVAIERHLRRRNVESQVDIVVRQPLVCSPRFITKDSAEVTVLIPTRNQLDRVKKCVEDVRTTTDDSVHIRIIDNQSDDPRLFEFYRAQESEGRFQVLSFDEPFNFARMHNFAIESLDTEFVVLLNNDVFSFSNDWVDQLVATARLSDDIGCVGALLRYPDGMTQHGGVSFGVGRPCRHIHLGTSAEEPGYCGRLQAIQQLSALTAALLLVRRETYVKLGGFDEKLFPVSYNDTDLCLKMLSSGYRSIYNPRVTAIHEESVSRGRSPLEKKWRQDFIRKWGDVKSDPFYNPHLSRREYSVDEPAFRVWRERKLVSLQDSVRAA